ncbi:hypothetical protein GOODEAATRI_027500 [Goodea atripinnis]|uniref:Sulfhydryl oxidase flavin adenine dinucleotide (FAD) binding domain-containing protein n=1 Tax=Goodea atripinnis TaxID=208336 RepID=A0ABV0NF18_9TELE
MPSLRAIQVGSLHCHHRGGIGVICWPGGELEPVRCTGVQRRSSFEVAQMGALKDKQNSEPWRDFDRSKVYTADLESALHYLLRVELAAHSTLEGEELKVFKDFVTLVAKVNIRLNGRPSRIFTSPYLAFAKHLDPSDLSPLRSFSVINCLANIKQCLKNSYFVTRQNHV